MPDEGKEQEQTYGEFLRELQADLERLREDPARFVSKQVEVLLWIKLTAALRRANPRAEITDNTPLDDIVQLTVSSMQRLAELESLIKPRKPGSGRKRSFTPEDVAAAIRRLGAKANQKQVAKRIGVTERALRSWQKQQGFATWADVKKHYLSGDKARPVKRKKK